MQGKIETQGHYNDVLKSGMDIASILNKSEENCDEEKNEDDGIIPRKNTNSSIKTIEMGSGNLNSETVQSKDTESDPIATSQLLKELKELEASSRGKVKGPLLLNYFKSAKRPFTLALFISTFLLAQFLASSADIWVSYW